MTIPMVAEHMSKQTRKGNNFPPLQKRIILHLAQSEPQNKNQIAKGIKGHYKSCWNALESLKKQGVIKEVKSTEYPLYWLTQAGVFVALVEGANPHNLLGRTIKTYPDDKTLQCTLEIAPLVGLEGFRIALSAVQDKGKLDDSDMSRMLFAGIQRDMSLEQFKELFKILKKYPTEYERAKKQMGAMSKLIAKLMSLT